VSPAAPSPALAPIERAEARLLPTRVATRMTIAGRPLERDRAVPVVRLQAGGLVGYGEAPPLRPFTGLDGEATLDGLRAALPRLRRRSARDALASLHAPERLAATPAPVRCALDVALHDLIARQEGVPIDRLLAPRRSERVRVGRAIGFHDVEETLRLVRGYRARGIRAFKLKVGRGTSADVALVEAVRRELGEEAELAIDANGVLSVEEATSLARALRGVELAYVEQPVAAADLDGLAAVREAGVRVMVDESVFSAGDVEAVARHGAADLVTLTLLKSGGLAPAVEMARAARRHGLGAAVVDPLGSAISLSAGLALATVLPPAGVAHGLSAGYEVDAPHAPHRVRSDGTLPALTGPGLGVAVRWPEDAATHVHPT
jgi:muconate cycloisomerase